MFASFCIVLRTSSSAALRGSVSVMILLRFASGVVNGVPAMGGLSGGGGVCALRLLFVGVVRVPCLLRVGVVVVAALSFTVTFLEAWDLV